MSCNLHDIMWCVVVVLCSQLPLPDEYVAERSYHSVSTLQLGPHCMWLILFGGWYYKAETFIVELRPGSQYDARASVASRASGWRWNRLDFYSNVALRALASVQPIRLSKNLTSGMQFDWWKRDFFPWRSRRSWCSRRQRHIVNQV